MFVATIGVRGFDRLTSSVYVFDVGVVFLHPVKAAQTEIQPKN